MALSGDLANPPWACPGEQKIPKFKRKKHLSMGFRFRLHSLIGLLSLGVNILFSVQEARGQWAGYGQAPQATAPWMPTGYCLPAPASVPFSDPGLDSFSFSLPDPRGQWRTFWFRDSRVMAPDLARRYPGIRTFQGYDPQSPGIQVRMEWTPLGLTAEVRGGEERYSLAPLQDQPDWYWVYSHGDPLAPSPSPRQGCLHSPGEAVFARERPWIAQREDPLPGSELRTHGESRRTYRLALAANAEYSQAVSGGTPTKPLVLAAMVISVNRINGILERELAVRLELIPQTEDLIYLFEPDPYGNHNPFQVQTQNQANIDAVVGTAHYDIGHVFTTGAGGLAELASVCHPETKAMAVTGQPNPVGDRFDVDYVAHEMGHQLGATHSFNALFSGSCLGNAFRPAAYEPGSGSTIMSYAGLCGPQNDYALYCDDYFHRVNLLQIRDFLSHPLGGGQCGSTEPGMPAPSSPSLGQHYFIPAHTPFELEVDSTEPGTFYSWEQWNLGEFGIDFSLARVGPLFRSFPPQPEGKRVFPRMESLVNGPPYPGERLPDTAQELVFVLTVRSLDQGWGSFRCAEDSLRIQVMDSPRPFSLIDPGPSRSHWQAGEQVQVKWDPVGTASPPISCTEVDIWLSLDGGGSFPILLASAVSNNGEAWVTLPAGIYTRQARVKVKARQNLFFALSPRDFSIDPWPESLKEIPVDSSLVLYPNPGGDFLELRAPDTEVAEWKLFDLRGRLLDQGEYPRQNRISTAHWASGLYLLEWTSRTGKGRTWRKWQKL